MSAAVASPTRAKAAGSQTSGSAPVVSVRAAAVPDRAQPTMRMTNQAAVMARSSVRLQTSLRLSSPNDPAEREAVATASKIMRMPVPENSVSFESTGMGGVFRELKKEDSGNKLKRPALSIRRSAAPSILAMRPAEERRIQRQAEGQSPVSSNVTTKIQGGMAGGSPLPMTVRRFMEPRFGTDFSRIRIHAGSESATLNRQLNAQAFAISNHIFFGKDKLNPESREGKELIAHELTHTIQQGAAVQRSEELIVTQQSPTQVQRQEEGDQGTVLNYFAEKANLIPGFRMFTIVLGVNPINMSKVSRNAANILRAIIELLPMGGLVTQALDNSGVFEKAGAFVEQQLATLAITGAAIKQAVKDFIAGFSLLDLARPGKLWDQAKRIFTDPIERIINFAKGLVSGIVDLVKDAILRPIAKLAEGTDGYALLKAVIGKDPITGDPVPQTAETLIGPFMKLIGENEIWENMQKANAISRAFAWFKDALGGLMGFVRQIPGLFIAAFKALQLEDIILVPLAFGKLAKVFGNFLGKFFDWAGGTIWKLLEIIFDVVSPGALSYIKKTGAALKSILKNPLPFVGNLVKAAKQGFQNFADNFGTHLKAGLIDWLTGSLPGVYIPKAFSLGEIVKFVFSVLGLSWQNVRQKLVKAVGETAVKAMETGFDIVVTLVKDGPAAAWEKIKEQLANLKDMVIGGITDFVVDMVVKKAVPKLIAMFIPGAGFISAILSIYDTVMVFVNKISKIIQVVTGFIDSIVAIAGGAIGAAANRVESTLAGLLSLAINFLAGFAGLGKVADKVMAVINKVRAPIDKALDWLVGWIAKAAQKIIDAAKRVVQFGLPKDPKERLRLGLDAAVAAVNALRGASITAALINPVLTLIKLRYGFKVLQPIEIAGEWWIEGIVNPPDRKKTNKKAGAAKSISYNVGDMIKARYGSGALWVARITQKTETLVTYQFLDPTKGTITRRVDLFEQAVASEEIQPYVADRRGTFMGSNPPRGGPIFQLIVRRYQREGLYRTMGDPPIVQVRFPENENGHWVSIDACDLSHEPEDAVSFWNREGYKHGPRSAVVRAFMTDPSKYIFEPSELNRQRRARHDEEYRDPLQV